MNNRFKSSSILFLGIIGLITLTPQMAISIPTPSNYRRGGEDAQFIRNNFYSDSSVNDIFTRKVDLSGNGVREILVVNTNRIWCGSAGCATEVYSYRNGKWENILNFTGHGVFVMNTSTRGWKDLATNDNERLRAIWTYNGREYDLGYFLDSKHNFRINPNQSSGSIIRATNGFDGPGTNYAVRNRLTANQSLSVYGFITNSRGQKWYLCYIGRAGQYNPFYVHKSVIRVE